MRARTSSNFGLIGPPTAELAGLERLKKSPYTYIVENGVASFSQLFLIKFFSYLKVMMTYIRAWMSSKFGQIRSWTTELSALEHLKIDVAPFLVSQLWLYLEKCQVSVYRTIGHLFIIIIYNPSG